MDHLILNNGCDSAALAEVALEALREARRSKTSNSGSIFVSDGQTDDDGISLGTGTIINGVDGGIQPWVGDTTPPGKPTGLTASSRNAAITIMWDGTLDGGIPSDFHHITVTGVRSSDSVSMTFGDLSSAGSLSMADLTAGDEWTITAIAYDDAHLADGTSAPNASVPSDAVTVAVESAVSASEVQAIQSDLSKAQSDIAAAESSMTDLTTTVSSVDGKATTSGSAPTASDASGKPEGAMWYVMDANGNLTDTYILKSGAWVKYAWASSSIADEAITNAKIASLDAGKITSGYVDAARIQAGTINADKLAAGSVTSDKIVANAVTSEKLVANAVTADKLAANSVTAVKLAAGSVTADKADIGSLAAAIVTSSKFKTSNGRMLINDDGLTAKDANGNTTVNIPSDGSTPTMVGGLSTASNGKHISISQSGDVGKLSLLNDNTELANLTFIDDTANSGYAYTGLYTGQNGQFLQFATPVDPMHASDPLQDDASFTSNGRMGIEAPYGINVNGTWFARDQASLPTAPHVAGGQGTKAFAGGIEYTFDGRGTWTPQSPLMVSGMLSGTTNRDGVILLTYKCPDGSDRVPDSIQLTYHPREDFTGRIYDPVIWGGPSATSAQIRYRRTDTNAWVGSGQGLDTYYTVFWNPDSLT